MPISKLEAAQRQLDCAIRLYFGNDDLLSVHALSHAAFRVIYDLHKPIDEYRAIVEHLTPEMKAFHLWMKVSNPDKFPSVREPDWEFEQDYLDANQVMKDAPRETRMLTGKVLLQLLRKEAEQTSRQLL